MLAGFTERGSCMLTDVEWPAAHLDVSFMILTRSHSGSMSPRRRAASSPKRRLANVASSTSALRGLIAVQRWACSRGVGRARSSRGSLQEGQGGGPRLGRSVPRYLDLMRTAVFLRNVPPVTCGSAQPRRRRGPVAAREVGGIPWIFCGYPASGGPVEQLRRPGQESTQARRGRMPCASRASPNRSFFDDQQKRLDPFGSRLF